MGEFVSSGSGNTKDGGNVRYVHHQGQFFQRVILFLLHLVFFLPFWESKLVFEWPRRITQSKFFILFSSRCHGGRTRRLCGADLHGCATGLQNRTHRHNAPHAAEQTAAPMNDSQFNRQLSARRRHWGQGFPCELRFGTKTRCLRLSCAARKA